MEHAVLNDGRRINLAAYIAIRDELGGARLKCFCPSCNAPVHPNRSLAAVGFRASRKEITRRVSSQKIKPVAGFSHYPHGAGANCKKSYANDPNFKGRPSDLEYLAAVRAKNEAVFAEPKMQKAILHVQEYLMQRLTGRAWLNDDDKKQLAELAKDLMGTAGLHEYPWLLPYMQALLMGNKERAFKSGWVARAVYVKRGEQQFEFTDIDGEKRILTAPYMIVLSRVTKNPDARPVISLRTVRRMPENTLRSEIKFYVRQHDAHDMAKEGLMRDVEIRKQASPRVTGRKVPVHQDQLRLI